jgi:GDPmannose 4,6-dehydratase
MYKAFITGITGQDGAYLAKFLLDKGYEVHGGHRFNSTLDFWRLERLGIKDKINLVPMEFADFDNVIKVVEDHPVDEFYNLAAITQVPFTFSCPDYTDIVNNEAVRVMLDNLPVGTKFFQASTSSLFEDNQCGIQNESTEFAPISPYAKAKLRAHEYCELCRKEGTKVYEAIMFNHESPLKDEGYIFRKITKQLREVFELKRKYMEIGYMDGQKDFSYAGDIVRGMWLIMQGKPDVYCLGSGEGYTIRDIIEETWFQLSGDLMEWRGEGMEEVGIGMDSVNDVKVKINPKYYRRNDNQGMKADISKAKSIGFKIEYDFKKFISKMLHDGI